MISFIEKRFGQTPFRGLTSKGFTAMGDTRGLVLVVKKGRTWLPLNGVRSDVYPTDVVIGHGKMGNDYSIKKHPYLLHRS